jgi:hypothetical protein
MKNLHKRNLKIISKAELDFGYVGENGEKCEYKIISVCPDGTYLVINPNREKEVY